MSRRANRMRLILLSGYLTLAVGCVSRSSEDAPAPVASGEKIDTARNREPRPADNILPPLDKDPLRKSAAIAGQVLLDGKPLDKGTITFAPQKENAKLQTSVATITDGRYGIEKMSPGKYKVAISSPRVTGKKKVYESPNSPTADVTVEILPSRYNSPETTLLTVTIEEGSNSKNFELTSR